MCGIAGFFSKKYDLETLKTMTNSISHRGPDASGYFFDEKRGVGLGHRRLSILDLSDDANQPMTSQNERYKIVYNGEVYNFNDIKADLEGNFHTKSDTEVVLEAFNQWGVEFVNRLNGMFAIAIYDLVENKMYLFRDRVGIKPLYYYCKDGELVFGSEIKAIVSSGRNLSINKAAIANFLHFGYVPNEDTIYGQVFKLPAGHYAEYNGSLKISSYWDLEEKLKSEIITDFDAAKSKLKEVLYDSVEKRLISDVPIGTFLSGGTDSSLITAIASKVSRSPVNSFSIGFKEAKYNECEKAKEIANYLKTNHHEFIVSEQDVLSELDEVLNNFDEPFADSSCFPTYLVSKLARKHVTVCLSGDGGDELFMGYGSYNWAERLSNPLMWNFRKPIALALGSSSSIRNKRASLVFNSPVKNRMSHIFSQEQYLFSADEIEQLLISDSPVLIEEYIKSPRSLSAKEKQSIFDIKNYLKDDLLVKVDRASMLSSLEVRVPLLDHRVVDFALNLDEQLKVSKGGVQKHLLKEVLYDLVPQNVLDHPKWGFSIPLSKWLTTDLYYLIEKYLDDEIIEELGICNLAYVKNLKKEFLSGKTYLYNRIWQLIVLNKFLLNR